MKLLELFFGFLKVGCFSFGGAYGAIPLIRDVVLSYGWLDEENLAYMIAVSESTPGPIMVNLATYVGSHRSGLAGAAVATLGVVLPSFLIILLIMVLLKTAWKHPYVQAALGGMKPCVIGIVLATGIQMILRNIFPAGGVDLSAVAVTAVLAGSMAGYRRFRKKKMSPLALIALSAAVGVMVYSVL